ncbi:MAG: phosphatase [Lachnospiraceae bacterium]|nr:phosphatase [Lachnospiraceae bacterium]
MSIKDAKILIDTHTHTVVSGHAWSTLKENCIAAKEAGLKKLCLTEHGPAMPAATPYFIAKTLPLIPDNVEGIGIIRGLEFNIIDFNGTLDVTKKSHLKYIEFGIASMHDVVIDPGTSSENTEAYLVALNNPYVDILGHPGNAKFPVDPEAIVLEAKKLNKLIEINNNSFSARAGSRENCFKFAKLCKKYGVRVCVASDAHFYTAIGEVSLALDLLYEAEFPEELVLNLNLEAFNKYIKEREKKLE